jgi:hypothetical protein
MLESNCNAQSNYNANGTNYNAGDRITMLGSNYNAGDRITMQGIELQCQVELQHHPSNYNVGAKLQWLWDTAIKFRSPAIPFVNVILLIITSGYNRPTNPGDA